MPAASAAEAWAERTAPWPAWWFESFNQAVAEVLPYAIAFQHTSDCEVPYIIAVLAANGRSLHFRWNAHGAPEIQVAPDADGFLLRVLTGYVLQEEEYMAWMQQDPHHLQRRATDALEAIASAEIQCASPAASVERLAEGDDAAAAPFASGNRSFAETASESWRRQRGIVAVAIASAELGDFPDEPASEYGSAELVPADFEEQLADEPDIAIIDQDVEVGIAELADRGAVFPELVPVPVTFETLVRTAVVGPGGFVTTAHEPWSW